MEAVRTAYNIIKQLNLSEKEHGQLAKLLMGKEAGPKRRKNRKTLLREYTEQHFRKLMQKRS